MCRAKTARKNHPFLLLFFLCAQPRSAGAVCRALNKLIPYLWGLGTIYLGCNVIRATGWRRGIQQVLSSANTLSFHRLTPLLSLLHPHLNRLRGDCVAVTGNRKIAYSSCLSKPLRNKQISCKSLRRKGLQHLHQRWRGEICSPALQRKSGTYM